MRCYPIHVHSLYCFLPPYILRQIVQNGTPQQRTRATQTLASDATFRALRLGAGRGARLAQKKAAVLGVEGEKRRTIFDTHQTQNFPGDVVRVEGQEATKDPAVDEAYDGLGATYDFFWQIFERHSIDDDGLALNAIVHFGMDYNNAFWDGQQMVFGDGDGDLFNRFTVALDVIGHELTHGVTEDEAQLQYFNQSGALNESMSDVFGVLVKQYVLQQEAQSADWLIGAGLLTANVRGVALRSMRAPGTAFDDPILGKDPQPAHMRDFVRTFEDNGGVHINSGIPNHAFYLVATQLGGYAWERAGRIWYETLRDSRLRPNSGFRTFARLTIYNAVRLYTENSPEVQAVRSAWEQVGILIT